MVKNMFGKALSETIFYKNMKRCTSQGKQNFAHASKYLLWETALTCQSLGHHRLNAECKAVFHFLGFVQCSYRNLVFGSLNLSSIRSYAP